MAEQLPLSVVRAKTLTFLFYAQYGAELISSVCILSEPRASMSKEDALSLR